MNLEFAVPSECADRVRAGRADLGIIPVVEMHRQGLGRLREVGIASDGAVRSILLISKVPFSAIRTLAADTSSRTSVVLSQVILSNRYNASVALIPHPPDLEEMLEQADAALLIGDPALRIEPATLPYECLDLGAEWQDLAGLPMIYALWSGRQEFLGPDWERVFAGSLSYGAARVNEIAEREAAPRGIAPALAREYLTNHIHFRLDERYHQGLARFLDLAMPYL